MGWGEQEWNNLKTTCVMHSAAQHKFVGLHVVGHKFKKILHWVIGVPLDVSLLVLYWNIMCEIPLSIIYWV